MRYPFLCYGLVFLYTFHICHALLNSKVCGHKPTTGFTIKFKDGEDSDKSSDQKPSFLENLKRYLPWTSQAKVEKSYNTPLPSSRMRFHFRLRNPDVNFKRHIVTRIIRYFPDISWETAEDIVARAEEEGASLIRVLSSEVCSLRLFARLR